jgi:hypothetical protein
MMSFHLKFLAVSIIIFKFSEGILGIENNYKSTF